MNEIHQEFEQHLAGWQSRYAGHPDREILRLSLLALEREENVAVAYGDGVLKRRLAGVRVPSDMRDVMQQALARCGRMKSGTRSTCGGRCCNATDHWLRRAPSCINRRCRGRMEGSGTPTPALVGSTAVTGGGHPGAVGGAAHAPSSAFRASTSRLLLLQGILSL
jgi:hypothetical protein